MAALAESKSMDLMAAFVASVKDPGKYHDGNGTGLFLLVKELGFDADAHGFRTSFRT